MIVMWYHNKKGQCFNFAQLKGFEVREGKTALDDSFVVADDRLIEQFPNRELCSLFVDYLLNKIKTGQNLATYKEFVKSIPYEKRKVADPVIVPS